MAPDIWYSQVLYLHRGGYPDTDWKGYQQVTILVILSKNYVF